MIKKHQEVIPSPNSVQHTTCHPFQTDSTSECRICLEDDLITNLMRPCACNSLVHGRCLVSWIEHRNSQNGRKGLRPCCQVCCQRYMRITPRLEYKCASCKLEGINVKQLVCNLIMWTVGVAILAGSLVIVLSSAINKAFLILLVFGTTWLSLSTLRIISMHCMEKQVTYEIG